jgi:hypothetical protein
MRVLGLKVRTGFAVGVIVAGRRSDWRLEGRLELKLCEGEDSRFPFHPLIELPPPEGSRVSRRLVAGVERAAERYVGTALKDRPSLTAAAIAVGSLTDPDRISSPHMRVHAREGELYRSVLARELKRQGIESEFIEEKTLRPLAAAALGVDAAEVLGVVTRQARGQIKPWRADEKHAVLAALWKLPA